MRELCEAGLAVCLDGDGEIRRFEEVALHLGNLDVVFNNQNLVHWGFASPFSWLAVSGGWTAFGSEPTGR